MNWTLHQGDALTLLPSLPAHLADLVFTDPPYNSGGRTSSERRNDTARGKYVKGDAQHDLADFTGDNRDQRGFVAWLSMIMAECLRISRPGASVLIFTDWRQLPASSDALQAGGWTWRGIIPWAKPISRPKRDGFRAECEYVLWGSNGQPHRHASPVYLPGLVRGSQPRGAARHHITAKPVEVLRQLIQVCPAEGTVLDPFAGSGSTGVAALLEGRHFVGIELSGHYADVARGRLRTPAS